MPYKGVGFSWEKSMPIQKLYAVQYNPGQGEPHPGERHVAYKIHSQICGPGYRLRLAPIGELEKIFLQVAHSGRVLVPPGGHAEGILWIPSTTTSNQLTLFLEFVAKHSQTRLVSIVSQTMLKKKKHVRPG